MSKILDVLLVASGWAHVYLAPYTKVEESFNLHAVHDILMYGVRPDVLKHYDHFVFPGAVPRTFIGSLALAWVSTPFVHLMSFVGGVTSKSDIQVIVRLVLTTLNAFSFCALRRAVSRRFGGPTGVLFVFLTCSQFHVPFWMGRTLPNMFALLPVNLALFYVINRGSNSIRPSSENVCRAISLLTFVAVILRSEVLLLLGPFALQFWVSGYSTLSKIIKTGVFSGICAMILTLLVDSYFWKQLPMWPELYGIYFNVIEGKSADWGISPFHTYFTNLLPKLLLTSLPLSLIGGLSDSRIRELLYPTIAFLLLISGLGHKEWRFVVYVVPLFNIAAARGASWMISRRKGVWWGRLCFAIVGLCIAANCSLTVLHTQSSMVNYPGGDALARFNAFDVTQEPVHVHISNLAAQTGASLFLQQHAPPYAYGIVPTPHPWTYDKTENLSPAKLTATRAVTHVIAEADDVPQFSQRAWTTIEVVSGFVRRQLNPRLWPLSMQAFTKGGLVEGLRAFVNPWVMVTTDQIVILERK